MRGIANQKLIAERLGISQAAVSHALRGTSQVGERTRQRVLDVASELGYRPNASAQAMRLKRFNCVAFAVVSEDSVSYAPPALIDGAHDRLAAGGQTLTYSKLSRDQINSSEFVPHILAHLMVDGLLINYGVDVPDQLIELVRRFSIPTIWLNNKREVDCIYPDEIHCCHWATRHLIELGHQRIAYASSHLPEISAHFSEIHRRQGFAIAMEEAGLKPVEVHLDSDGHWMNDWTLTPPDRRLTAFVTNGPVDAGMVYAAGLRHGLRMPRDFSLIMVSDNTYREAGQWIDCVRIPFYEMGSEGVRLLMEKIENPSHPLDRVMVPPREMEQKGSTAPPPDL